MKKIFTLILIVSSLNAIAQGQVKGFHLDRPINMAAILATRPSTAMGFSSVSEARSIISNIMNAVDMQQNFQVMSTTQVDNAAAVIYQGTRYILYNPSFINQLDNVANDKWASISVLGHEIGHHLLGHTLDGTGSQIPKELAADQFSGLVLHRMGASLQQAQLAMKLIGSPVASATHPAEQDRLIAIAKGWNSTGVQTDRGNSDVVINTPTDDRRSTYPDQAQTYPSDSRSYPSTPDRGNSYPNTGRTYPGRRNRNPYPDNTNGRSSGSNGYPGNSNRRSNSIDQSIAYDIRFNGAGAQQYFITTQNDVIMLRRNQAVVVAKVAATNRSNYPYVIYDDQQQIFIDQRGNLLTSNGRKVGSITRHL
jgi:hypothetical protein